MQDDKKTIDTMVSELVAALVAGLAAASKTVSAAAKDGMTAAPGVVVQGDLSKLTPHTQPAHRYARDLKQVTDVVELGHWFSEFGEQATPKRIGEIYVFERDQNIPEEQQTKFYRR